MIYQETVTDLGDSQQSFLLEMILPVVMVNTYSILPLIQLQAYNNV